MLLHERGYVTGTLLWFSDALACGGVAAALADVAVSVLPPQARAPAHAAVIIGAIGTIAWVNIGGVARGTRLVNAATLLKLVPVSQILFGTDFPFSSAEAVAKGLSDVGFKASDLRAIERENALELFPRLKSL